MALLRRETDYDRFEAQKPFTTRARDWAAENRYSIVFASWVASMGIALAIVRRNPYLSTGQKLVQSRVYAQGLTLGVLLASFGIEASDVTAKRGRWETVKVLDPSDPSHKRLIDKRIHHERYEGEDQWMGKRFYLFSFFMLSLVEDGRTCADEPIIEVIAAEEQREKDRKKNHERELQNIRDAQAKAHNNNNINNNNQKQ
jgi:hypothetical protein